MSVSRLGLTRRKWLLQSTLTASASAIALPAWAQNTAAIKIGRTAALSGPFSYPYVEMGKGIKAAFQEVNAKGGIDKRLLQLIEIDDQGMPAVATENTKNLLEKEQVFAFLGCGPTQTVMAMTPLLLAAKTPLIAPGTGVDALRAQYNPLFVYTRPTYGAEVAKIAQQINTIGHKKCAVLYSDNALGKSVLAAFENAAKKLGNTEWKGFIYTESPDSIQRVTDEVAVWAPTSVLSSVASPSGVAFFKAFRSKVKAPVYTFSLLGPKPLLDAVGEGAENVTVSQVVPNPENSVLPVVKEYTAAMRKIKEMESTYSSLEGYIAARVLIEGLRRSKGDTDRERFIRSFLTMRPLNLGGFELSYSSSDNTGSNYVELTYYSKGKFRR